MSDQYFSELYDLDNQVSHISLEELKEEEERVVTQYDEEVNEGINASYDKYEDQPQELDIAKAVELAEKAHWEE